MIKGKDKTLYDIHFKIYASGEIHGRVSGKCNGIPTNYLVVVNGNIDGCLWLYAAEDKYALADCLARFFTARPEIYQAVTELMVDDSDSEVTVWN